MFYACWHLFYYRLSMFMYKKNIGFLPGNKQNPPLRPSLIFTISLLRRVSGIVTPGSTEAFSF